MGRLGKLLLFGVGIAALTHVVAVLALPNVIMNIAMKRIAATAGGVNKVVHNPRVTPQNQAIVRSSPDLAYSLCVLDLSKGPVRIALGKSADYVSAAFYAANTDNVFTLKDTQFGPDGARIIVHTKGNAPQTRVGETRVELPSAKGLMLVRRLAPSAEMFARVEGERASDRCE
jgi:uncharacterized membrane protein